jgi:hypothetical protein
MLIVLPQRWKCTCFIYPKVPYAEAQSSKWVWGEIRVLSVLCTAYCWPTACVYLILLLLKSKIYLCCQMSFVYLSHQCILATWWKNCLLILFSLFNARCIFQFEQSIVLVKMHPVFMGTMWKNFQSGSRCLEGYLEWRKKLENHLSFKVFICCCPRCKSYMELHGFSPCRHILGFLLIATVIFLFIWALWRNAVGK